MVLVHLFGQLFPRRRLLHLEAPRLAEILAGKVNKGPLKSARHPYEMSPHRVA